MKHILTLTALLLAPVAMLRAADTPARCPNILFTPDKIHLSPAGYAVDA
ncbi:hypothetical protein BH11VER1_BH11VER1_29450 [soil metagenome]